MMPSRNILVPALVLVVAAGGYFMTRPSGGHENLEVLPQSGQGLTKGMRKFSKGLGVRCTACHIKDEHASDAKPEKKAARVFLAAVQKTQDPAARRAALEALLAALKLEKEKDETAIWAAFELWQVQ